MTKRTYICNVCQKEFGDSWGTTADVVGFEWSLGTVVQRQPYHAENHICVECLDHMHQLHGAVRKSQVDSQ